MTTNNTQNGGKTASSDRLNSLVRPSDSEMLDWLESLGDDYHRWCVQTETDYPNVKGCAWVKKASSSGFKSVRDAIAFAMSNDSQ